MFICCLFVVNDNLFVDLENQQILWYIICKSKKANGNVLDAKIYYL